MLVTGGLPKKILYKKSTKNNFIIYFYLIVPVLDIDINLSLIRNNFILLINLITAHKNIKMKLLIKLSEYKKQSLLMYGNIGIKHSKFKTFESTKLLIQLKNITITVNFCYRKKNIHSYFFKRIL